MHAERAPEALIWTPQTRGARSARTSSKQSGRPRSVWRASEGCNVVSLTHSTIRAPLATCQNEFVSEYNFICMNTQYTVHYLTTLRCIMVHYKGVI